jgi:hypothetical protein
MPESEMLQPGKIEVTCPFCQSDEVFIIDFIAGATFPLPEVFAIDCQKCGHTGSGYQDNKGWHIEWGSSSVL